MLNVAVIGCGAIGLTTGMEIQRRLGQRGKVTIFADKFTPNTTSDIAAGLWEPFILGDNSIEDIVKWSKNTYAYILQLWKEGKAKEAGICLLPALSLFTDKNYTLPKWATITLGYSEVTDIRLKSLNKEYNKQFTGGFFFTTFTWEAVIFLPYLQKEFLQQNGNIIAKHINSFDELQNFDVIVNCAGFEARSLANDLAIFPIRGQVLKVEAPWQRTCLLFNESGDNFCCIIPTLNSVVLGGTQQKSSNTTVSDEDSKTMTKYIFKIAPSFIDSKVIKEVVGLRPARPKVRLEKEFLKTPGGKVMKIVHNYGHGGAGITLCIGCAKDAADLVENMLQIDRHKL